MWKPIHDPNLRQKLQIWDKSFKFETKGSARLTRFSLSYQFILTSSEVLKTYLIPGYFEGVPHLKLSWKYTSLQVILKAYLISSYPESISHLKLSWRHTSSEVLKAYYKPSHHSWYTSFQPLFSTTNNWLLKHWSALKAIQWFVVTHFVQTFKFVLGALCCIHVHISLIICWYLYR